MKSKKPKKSEIEKDSFVYCVKLLPSGHCVELNRNYKPAGRGITEHVDDYESFSFPVDEGFLAELREIAVNQRDGTFWLWSEDQPTNKSRRDKYATLRQSAV